MSSILRSPYQIDVRSKYLLVVTDPSADPNVSVSAEYFGVGGASIIQITTGSLRSLGSKATIDEIAETSVNILPYVNVPDEQVIWNGRIFKDLGRSLTIYDPDIADSPHIATYRQCQLISGSGSEGVANSSPLYDANFYIRVWAADGVNVAVARLG
jgi:hypothetical protein